MPSHQGTESQGEPYHVTIAATRTEPGQLPKLAHEGDAGYDITAAENQVIPPAQDVFVRTGIRISIPRGFAGLVLPRSGLAINSGITLTNHVGLIDADFRGELKISLHNGQDKNFTITVGDRIAQLVILPIPIAQWHEVPSLDPSLRGESGYGSTGVRSATSIIGEMKDDI